MSTVIHPQYHPLTHSQKRVRYFEMVFPGTTAQNIIDTVRLEGEVDFTLLEKAINITIHKNDALRLRIVEIDNDIRQYVSDYHEQRFERLDFRGTDGAEKLENWIHCHLTTPLDLFEVTLFYFALIRFNPHESGFLIKIHHMITDGWSMSLIINQILEHYDALKNQQAIPEENQPSYLEYVNREIEYLESRIFEKHRKFWNEKYRTIPAAAGLKYYQLDNTNSKAVRKVFPIPQELTAQVYQFTDEHDISIFRLFVAILYQYLALVTFETDIVLGTMTHNRYNPEENNMIGMFANAAAIRINPGQDLDFNSLLKTVNNELTQVIFHQKYPFDLLMQDLREKDKASELPSLFDTLISYQRVRYNPGIKREYHYHETEEDPLRLHIEDIEGNRLEMVIHYRTVLFTGDEMERMAKQLINLLSAAINYPSQKLSWVHLLSEDEKNHWLSVPDNCGNTGIKPANENQTGAEATLNRRMAEKVTQFINKTATILNKQRLTLQDIREYWFSEFPDFILPAYYLRLHKTILTVLESKKRQNTSNTKLPLKLAVAASFTSEPIADYILYWGKKFDLGIEVEFAPYNQVFQELLDPNSLLSTNRGINLLLVRFEDWIRNDQTDETAKCKSLERNFTELAEALQHKPKTIPYFAGVFPVSTHLSLSAAVVNCLETLNARWKKMLAEMEDVYFIDFSELAALYNIGEVFDAVKDHEGHLPFSDEYFAAMGTMIARRLYSWKMQQFKVIVLDCDHTLWEGICGEDGALGVRVTEPYRNLQQWMLKKYHEGMLLALCSKNNEADVWEVFAQNPQMILKKEHFAGWRINWERKPENLKALATELNVGLDSLIFIDDSAFEGSEMMAENPQILTLKLPDEPGQIPLFLEHVWAFDRLKITGEDKERNAMYLAERKRRAAQQEGLVLTDFLKSLELKMSLKVMDKSQLARVAQLTQRTNQFNLNTIRRTEAEINHLITIEKAICWVVEVMDRFGDYGLVGVIITKEDGPKSAIDTFLLSCRVLGRGVEEGVLALLKRYCREREIPCLEACYNPTDKNKPFLEFIHKTHWEKVGEGNGGSLFRLPVAKIPESIEFIQCYYLSSYPQVGPAAFGMQPEFPQNLPEGITETAKYQAHDWQVLVVNREKLWWNNHLLAVNSHTGALLLELPIQEPKEQTAIQNSYAAPRTETETKLAGIWEKVLGVNPIGIHDNFVDLGGNSLKAVQVIMRARQIKLSMTITDIFQCRNIAKLTEHLNSKTGVINPDNKPGNADFAGKAIPELERMCDTP